MGNQNIIDEAWNAYQQKLLQFIKAKVSSGHDADDILNNVFVKLIKQTSNQQIPDNLPAWLYRVTRNSIVDYYRERKFEPLPDALQSEEPDEEGLGQLSECMLPMVKQLPEKYREVLLLTDINGEKQKAVAEALNLSLSAVKSRVLRGREILREKLLECCVSIVENSEISVSYDKTENDCCTPDSRSE